MLGKARKRGCPQRFGDTGMRHLFNHHLLDDCAGFFVRLWQSFQLILQMGLDLLLRFGQKSQIPGITCLADQITQQ